MQNISAILAFVHIVMIMSIAHRVLGMKYLEECTESELNRVTEKMFTAIKFRVVVLLVLVIASLLLVYQLKNHIALAGQGILTVIIILIWVSSTKEVVEFEMILLKRQVARVGRTRAVARLLKKSEPNPL